MMIMTVIGRNRMPASNALYPRISCMYSDMKKNVGEHAERDAERDRGARGERGDAEEPQGSMRPGLWRSYSRNATARAADVTSMLTISGSLQPFSLASIRA